MNLHLIKTLPSLSLLPLRTSVALDNAVEEEEEGTKDKSLSQTIQPL